MKTIILSASPNKDSRTKRLAEEYCRSAGIDYELMDVYKLNINPCIDCGYCRRNNGECSIKDDMEEVYDKLLTYDNVILASPLYFGMFSAPLKAIIDRTQMIWSKKYVFNDTNEIKRNGIIISTAGSEWTNMFSAMKKIGEYFFNTIDCKLIDMVTVTCTDEKDMDFVKRDIRDVAQRNGAKIKDKL